MSTEATATVLGLADDTQFEYAAKAASKTSASPARSLPQGEAEPDSFDVDPVGAPASEDSTSPAAFEHSGGTEAPLAPRPEKSPRFESVDPSTAARLLLIAEENPATPQEVREWNHFVKTLREIARATGLIDQNAVRPLLRGEVKPNRIGAFYCRAIREGLIRAEGWHPSDDLVQRNRGKPTRVYRWLPA
ncbi:MAG: hypothetical protein ACRDQD_22905 [Nocardioidaceae bacterium]